MRFNHKILLRMTLLIALAPIASATTWYVNGVSGSDGNNCLSPTTACRSIGHAISLASSGDTIRVAGATYAESLGIGINLKVIGASASSTVIKGVRPVTISSANAHVTLFNLTLTGGNLRNNVGGGIYNKGTLTVNNSTISGNVTVSYCGSFSCGNLGGGIYNAGTLTVNNSTISGNTVATSGCLDIMTFCSAMGGGIANFGGTVKINNSTISGNTAIAHCVGGRCFNQGGGIYTNSASTVSSSTISGNGKGGGIFNDPRYTGTITLQNTIVANSLGNCVGTLTSNGYNLSSDGSCTFNRPGDKNNTDPMLGPLQNNGGPTQTMALPSGSPAVDAGNPGGCRDSFGNLLKTDQRGSPRHDQEDTGGCDIGAFERQSD